MKVFGWVHRLRRQGKHRTLQHLLSQMISLSITFTLNYISDDKQCYCFQCMYCNNSDLTYVHLCMYVLLMTMFIAQFFNYYFRKEFAVHCCKRWNRLPAVCAHRPTGTNTNTTLN